MKINIPEEGVINAPIDFMVVKDSVFIPTLNPEKLKQALRKAADELGFKFVYRTVVVDGYVGVNVWRVG